MQELKEKATEQIAGTNDSERFLITGKLVTFQGLLYNFYVTMQIVNRVTAEQQRKSEDLKIFSIKRQITQRGRRKID